MTNFPRTLHVFVSSCDKRVGVFAAVVSVHGTGRISITEFDGLQLRERQTAIDYHGTDGM